MIGYRMLYAVAVGLPILAAAYLGAAVLRSHGRRERWIWVLALGLAFLLPSLYLTRPPRSAAGQALEATEAATGSATEDPSDPGPIGLRPPNVIFVSRADAGFGLDEALLIAWFLASAGLALRWIVSARRLSRLAETWRRDRVGDTDVWVTRRAGPAVAGVLRPTILVPDWLLSLPEEQRSLVLLHEREHLEARDPWLMGLSRIARVLTPWNPVVWAASAGLLRAVEADCDRRVLLHGPDARAYCDTLLAISSRSSLRMIGAAAFAEPRISLQRRIISMTTPPRSISALGGLALLGLAALLVFGSCGVPLPTERDAGPSRTMVGATEDFVTVDVGIDGQVAVNGVPSTLDDISTVVGELVREAERPLVTNLVASGATPYRIMDQVQRELVEAGARRVLYYSDPPPAGSDGSLALVMPESVEQMQVSRRNVLTLTVRADGDVEAREGAAETARTMSPRDIDDLWREEVAKNPNLIASVHHETDATYAQVMAVLDALHSANAQRISLWGIIRAQ